MSLDTNDAKAQATQDRDDIAALQKTPAFDRYYLRRLRDRRERLGKEILEDDMPHDVREQKRQVYLEYGQILTMLDTDLRSALAQIRD